MKKARYEGLPKELLPRLFRLSGITKREIIARLFVIYILFACLCILAYGLLWQIDLGSVTALILLKILSVAANPLSLYFISLSILIDKSSEKIYVEKHIEKAHALKGWETKDNHELETILQNLFGHTAARIKSVLDTEVGMLLLAISSTFAFIVNFVEHP